MIRIYRKKSWKRSILLGIGLMAGCSAAALAADTITGVARNQTRGQFATGDEVILLRLDQGMQEEARTQTDPQGAFTLNVLHREALHLVRVVHEGVNYDQRALVGDTVAIDVFDAAAKVHGVAGNIEIIRIGTNGNLLHVSDMIEVSNDSSPPLTQAGERTFEVYLPPHAKIDSVLAAGSGKIGVMISAAPVPGEPDHYAVNFPLRPGSTKFAFNYDLPYDGRTAFRTKSEYPLQQLAVMLPPTMQFTSRSPAFQVLPTGNNGYQVEAANHVKAGNGLGFEISGVGALPALQAQGRPPAKLPVAALLNPEHSVPDSSQARVQGVNSWSGSPASAFWALASWSLWVWGACASLLLGACGFMFWRRPQLFAHRRTTVPQKTEQQQTPASRVQVWKDELFQLEVDRLHGTISGEEYASAKQALAGTVKQALARVETRR